MECPHCGKSNSEVIDSRPTKEGIAIRRRRQCLVCKGRFTTYEAREEHLSLVLVRKDAGPGPTIANLKTVLTCMVTGFKALTKETEKVIGKAQKLEKAEAAKKSKRMPPARRKVAVKKKASVRKKISAKRKVALKKKAPARKRVVPKAKTLSATATVLRIVKRHKRGVDILKLKRRTGFDDTRIRNIISKAYREGKIKRVGRGVYVAAAA